MLEIEDVCRSALEGNPNGGSSWSICFVDFCCWHGKPRSNRFAIRTINLI